MEETYLLKHPGVKKKILAGGTGPLPHFPPSTKIVFHFQTLKDNFERTVIDDSRLAKRPAEIFVGKMFKMEVWEVLLMSMRVGEVAEFWCDAMHTGLYPMVSKSMRLIAQGKDPLEGQKHMCGMGNMFNYGSTGWPELDELMREPQALIFIMELVQVGDPLSYKRESWMMEKDEKLKEVPLQHMQGNALVRQGRFKEASVRYQEAVLLLRTVQSREMPGDEDYINLSRLIIPLVLNYCQCMLELNEFYEVILHTSELLDKHKDCVKAYYKRAKAYTAVWDEKEARKDFNMVASLDISLAPLIHRELKNLSERMKEKYWEEKEKYWNILETEKKGEEEEEEEKVEEGKGSKEREPGEDDESTATVVEEGLKPREDSDPQQEVNKVMQAETEVANEEVESSLGTKTETNQISPSVTEGKDWQQMLLQIKFLQDEGNFRFKEHQYEEASGKFKEALEYVDFLQTKEVKYKGEDWESLEKVRLPLTLNLSQCMLELRDYQHVVELNDKLLKRNRGNIKALYQRARAHSALCNEEEARRDFVTVERLDPKFKPIVRQEMKKLGENMRAKHVRQKKTYWDSTQEKWGPGGTKSSQMQTSKTAGKKMGTKEVEGAKVGREEGDIGKSVPESAVTAVKEDEAKDKKTEGTLEEEKTKGKVRFSEAVYEGEANCGENKAESVAVLGETEAGLNNRAPHEDTSPAPATAAKDNVATRRSGSDKSGKKVKCQSNAAQGNAKGGLGNKGTNDNTGSGAGIQSGSTKRSQLSGTNPNATEVAGEGERSVTQKNTSTVEEERMRHVAGGNKLEGEHLDEQHSEEKSKTEPEVSTQNIDSSTKKYKRKQKKKK
ncbi:uncharacterized protein LOC134032538 isoform X2 [Osmerus eperlanus]|uniref:uncharacterized protein LOC134032538 isoform X2 n=1 Tax=Osmerus eperlanus TaxID=29151 RepID=UPI002E14B298